MTDLKDNFIANMSFSGTHRSTVFSLKYTGTWFDGFGTVRIEDELFDAFKTIGLADNRTNQFVKRSALKMFSSGSLHLNIPSTAR